MTSDALVKLAKALAPGIAATLRIGLITSLVGDKVTTDATGTALVVANSDSKLAVGDRVVLLQQRSVWVVAFRVSGGYVPPAVQTPIGAIVAWPSTTIPAGWLECDGSWASRSQYPALFAVCGTTYGVGNGSTSFSLPNLANRFPLGEGTRPAGEVGGQETVTLTEGQIPSHTHTTNRGGGVTTVQSGTGASVAADSAGVTGPKGGGGSHNNMPPFLTIVWIIRAS